MSRLDEIQVAITGLPSEQYDQFAKWFYELDQARWEEQIDRDSAAGKLDFLFEEAESKELNSWPAE